MSTSSRNRDHSADLRASIQGSAGVQNTWSWVRTFARAAFLLDRENPIWITRDLHFEIGASRGLPI